MSDLPPEMLKGARHPDGHFAKSEDLHRAFHPHALQGASLELDAIELPDMSVNRSKYGRPEWLLLLDSRDGWGVAAFQVADIPSELVHQGVIRFTFRPFHRPFKHNYPHSEVWAFENGVHIDAKEKLNPDLHLRWRERLLR